VAIIIGIARGFGFQEMIENQLTKIFPGQTNLLEMLFGFVQKYLEVATSGIVIGIGIVFLISSVWTILQSIEVAVNDIFQVKSQRSLTRHLSDYLSTMLLLPTLLILSSGFSVYLHTALAQNKFLVLLSPILNAFMTMIPYFICWFGFTLLYILIPNTKVKFRNAVLAGLIAGFSFQAFQYIYISGQIWVSRYNAIYGTFAAIPLFLLWLQFSWTIVLFGAEIAFAAENVQNFYFENESKNVSHRYQYFVSILIMNILCKRLMEEKGPMTSNEISAEYQIPTRLTNNVLNTLLELRIISETNSFNEKGSIAFLPAVDINKLTVGMLVERLFERGSEDFKLDTEMLYNSHWKALLKVEKNISGQMNDVLIKNL
ncbi:MAG: YihY/virulence factor BrkB family protein, partial [Bacteroidota bacterium]|nr:YihY/virulence factor BrkB family protein [Bacteroidota bacterium]